MAGQKKPKEKKIRQRPLLISDEIYFAVKRLAKENGLGVSEVIRRAVSDHLVKEGAIDPESDPPRAGFSLPSPHR